ncbi:M67 family metallopeptidase [Sneathiella glossodoripedis]|uniref:M67 family metallopeptidase n=1 Tax=Sneathiella glossodoripedis TaxID=418853 RepID=UPI0004729AF5|nr:M67 family metallopeptidase [Sneathiella glossodoripedis]
MITKQPVQIDSFDLKQLQDHARTCYPEEACALLVGEARTDGSYRVTEVAVCDNVASDKGRFFEVDPALRILLEKKLRNSSQRVLGVYHSHPDGQAMPSETDRKMVIEQDLLWLISSVDQQEIVETRVFLPTGAGDFRELALVQRETDGKDLDDEN